MTTPSHGYRHPLLERLIEQAAHEPELSFLAFWGPIPTLGKQPGPGVLCQWWNAPFMAEGVCYQTAEHYMMAAKARLFGDEEMAARIAASVDPSEAQYLGRKVRGYDEALWAGRRYQVVIEGNLHKFTQHRSLHDYLLATGEAVLVSANPTDRVWSIGYADDAPQVIAPSLWRGANLLGFALMEVRAQLRQAG